ncbi:MAG: diguanylate cyclase [Treponema sp.]|nr:diguanylate cyclase [Treponema sp.]
MIIALWLTIGTISVFYIRSAIMQHATTSMHFILDSKVSELNNAFHSLSKNVKGMKDFIEKSDVYDDDFYDKVKERSVLTLGDQLFVKSFYLCPDFETTDNSKCLYMLNIMNAQGTYRIDLQEDFIDVSFDVKSGKKVGKEFIPWYYAAKENKVPQWIGPYNNFNTEQQSFTISYFEPLYKNKAFAGVTGIEISNLSIRSCIDSLDYGEAFIFLVSGSGDLIYHKDFLQGLWSSDFHQHKDIERVSEFFSDEYVNSQKAYEYEYKGEKHKAMLERLGNGMVIALSVPEKQLFSLPNTMLLQIMMLLIISLMIAVFIVNYLTDKIVRPIEIITKATSFIAHGELNTKIPIKSKDELGVLATSILKIEEALSEYIEQIRDLAYRDFMTNCKNKSAYIKKISQIKKRITEDLADFTVYVFDVNGLKRINDTKGHEMGDELIKAAAGAIKTVFSEDEIFRTGGDEFAVITEGPRDKIKDNMASFAQAVDEFNKENESRIEGKSLDFTLAVSVGYASFENGVDKEYKSVYDRADQAMYEAKEAFYKNHEDMRRK